jgi:hypothetical protein
VTSLDVASDEAEQSVAQIFRTIAAHKVAVANVPPAPQARLGGPDRREAELQEKRQATLIRLVSIAESFAAELLWREVEADASAPAGSPTALLSGDAVIDATLTWEKQKAAYSDWFDVEPDWTPVKYLANARNAAAHGLGQLTRRQLRKEKSSTSLITAAKITVKDRRIVLTDENLDDAAATCRTFVEALDRAAQDRRP